MARAGGAAAEDAGEGVVASERAYTLQGGSAGPAILASSATQSRGSAGISHKACADTASLAALHTARFCHRQAQQVTTPLRLRLSPRVQPGCNRNRSQSRSRSRS
eukprot:SAG11_NODE_1108_length_5832_cov_2.338043_3_plen_105_part_00